MTDNDFKGMPEGMSLMDCEVCNALLEAQENIIKAYKLEAVNSLMTDSANFWVHLNGLTEVIKTLASDAQHEALAEFSNLPPKK